VPVLERMYEVHGNVQESTPAMLLSQRREMPAILVGRMETSSDRIDAELNLLCTTFGFIKESDDVESRQPFLSGVPPLLVRNVELKVLLKKISREIETDEKARSEDVVFKLEESLMQFSKALEYCVNASKEGKRFKDVSDPAEFVALCGKTAETCFDSSETSIGDALAVYLDIVHDGLGQVFAQLGQTNECVEGAFVLLLTFSSASCLSSLGYSC
jgi:hypothetical protein